MDPLSALLALLAGRPMGSGDILPNLTPGAGIPSTMGVGSALPGLSYSPYASPGSPFAGTSGGGSTATMSDPLGSALTGGTGGSGIGSADFLNGALFNILFPPSPTAAGAANPSSGTIAPTPTGAPDLPGLGGMPTSGGIGAAAGGTSGAAVPAGGGDTSGNGAGGFGAPASLGQALGQAQSGPIGAALPSFGPSLGGFNLGNFLSNTALGFGVNSLFGSPLGSVLMSLVNQAGRLGADATMGPNGMTLGQINAAINQDDPETMGAISQSLDMSAPSNIAAQAISSALGRGGSGGSQAGGQGLTGQEGITSLDPTGDLGGGTPGQGGGPSGNGPGAGNSGNGPGGVGGNSTSGSPAGVGGEASGSDGGDD